MNNLASIFMAKLDRGALTLFSSGSDRRKSPGILAQRCFCVRWLIANKLLLPGSWLERETHSLKLFKDIKKLVEVVPFPESQGLCMAVTSFAAPCQLVYPCFGHFSLDLVVTSSYCCGVDKCISYLQLVCSPPPLCEPEVFAGPAGSHRVTTGTPKPRDEFAVPLKDLMPLFSWV